MCTRTLRCCHVLIAMAAMLAADSAIATKYKAPASEVALLPRFCWGQYMENVDGPEYEIRDCGVYTNHYCDGLLELARAQKTFGNRNARIQHLQRAKQNTLYTLNGISAYPSCAIRSHVETTLIQVNEQLRAYSAK